MFTLNVDTRPASQHRRDGAARRRLAPPAAALGSIPLYAEGLAVSHTAPRSPATPSKSDYHQNYGVGYHVDRLQLPAYFCCAATDGLLVLILRGIQFTSSPERQPQ